MITLYGIKNCDSVKKAKTWLTKNSITFQYHDFRDDGLSTDQLKKWCDVVAWETLLNKRSTSWKNTAENLRVTIDKDSAIALMVETPTLIKRPVLIYNKHVYVGFSDKTFQQIFNS